VRKLGVRIPALIDGIDDKTEQVYTGWPERLYVVAPGGRIVYKSEAGPYGFSPKAMELALHRVLQPDMTAAKSQTTVAN